MAENDSATPYSTITYTVDEAIATITLARPHARNGFTLTMADELGAAITAADQDNEVRVILLTAEGDYFCVGMDFDDPTIGDFTDPAWEEPSTRVVRPMTNSNKPVIVAFQGPAVGVGLSMTLPADFRLATDSARFGFVFARRGLFPEGGSTWFLPQLVGLAKAKEWMLTARLFTAQEALSAGLLTSLHTPEDLLPAAYALARDLATNIAPTSAALIRRALVAMTAHGTPEAAFALDKKSIPHASTTPDLAEGISSFLQKRPPKFTGVAATDLPDLEDWLA
ncbi:enoyl-CoA hydratase-related protein [Nocardia huaxiensis]|uniref:Enoyl-CoA hydratase/isomerase family protein n=1 Tax=Nocardia huaxiensis TaxID=2755382 RepID=A0A7D6V8X2_9NOCA|nr:enoyl-CoA hydratase-related protein [Nocardia huaxiensis]QLY29674.1 enoyl-CoA hydratase/isomerase family protein [Nocardia huaxiensis]UFS96754.1 enoyl-CoA hydratase-related protein [Nocardia huaxiensis]